jgi:arylsulfatase
VLILNRAGDEAQVRSTVPVPTGAHTLAVRYEPSFDALPTVSLLHDDEIVASALLTYPMPFVWQHGGTALSLGCDRGFPVSADYAVPFAWNGTLHELVVDTSPSAFDPAADGGAVPSAEQAAHAERIELHRE